MRARRKPARPLWPDARTRLPGFRRNLGATILILSALILLPLAALILKAGSQGWAHYWQIISDPRALATYRLTISAAAGATIFNAGFGLLMAWILVRYRFPGRALFDAVIDLPFALPTAVSGLTLTTLFGPNGWFGAPLAALGLKVAYTPLGVGVAMAFTSLPFVVRAVQPVLADLDREFEEAAASLGAGPWRTFRVVIFPAILPALATGTAMAFARSLGEYGAVIFIAGNFPFRTEITSLLAAIRLDEFDYAGSAALSSVLLVVALAVIFSINLLERRGSRSA